MFYSENRVKLEIEPGNVNRNQMVGDLFGKFMVQ